MLRPNYADVHNNLVVALCDKGDLDGAIAVARAALRLRPDDAKAHNMLGLVLARKGDLDGAIAGYRAALRLKPDFALAYCNLGEVLLLQGHYPEGLEEIRTGHRLGSRRPDWKYPSAQWVAEAERLVRLSDRLSAVLRGEVRPRDAAEGIDLAMMAYRMSRHAAAARLYADSLEAEPGLADDRQAQHAYNAACCAALAGCGQGRDEPPPDDSARARLRQQALDWLRGEHAARSKIMEGGSAAARSVIAKTLRHWQQDPDLIGLRDAAALARLPEAEASAWRSLWADVGRSLARAEGEAISGGPTSSSARGAAPRTAAPTPTDLPARPFAEARPVGRAADHN